MKTPFQPTNILFICCLFTSLAFELEASTTNDELNRVVASVCDKKMVLLGEDANHGSARTMEIKVELVMRLIKECDFSAVFFESSVYEFIHVEKLARSNKLTEKQLADAIGGIWSTATPIQPLISYLHKQAIAGEVTLSGIDAQFSANQPFSQKELPKVLARYLDENRGKQCENELYRYLNWQYNEKSPYDEATKKRIVSCVAEIALKTNRRATKRSLYVDTFMADNFAISFSFEGGDYFNRRDKTMAKNIAWHASRLKDDAKIIVWCATIHAVKTLSPISKTKVPMGFYLHQSLGNKVASIGFSALTGKFGRYAGKATSIEKSDLEQQALLNDKELGYISTNDLKQMGIISAHPINYNTIQSANWAEILDGIVIIRTEVPLEL
ncbi:MAG: erythromycin esterase family protein [Kangiellaceae bacterium]|nr:erythromycin esterase family protein [Kangiellaceae bacterium]